jgi:sigma-E factor negative regulatory protein RseC
MIEQGKVRDIKGKRLIIDVKRSPACNSCKACSSREDGVMQMEFENTIGARKGDIVNIELDDALILRAAALFYAVPLLGLVCGLFLGWLVAKKTSLGLLPEPTSALFGICIMIMSFATVRKKERACGERYKPKIYKGGAK